MECEIIILPGGHRPPINEYQFDKDLIYLFEDENLQIADGYVSGVWYLRVWRLKSESETSNSEKYEDESLTKFG